MLSGVRLQGGRRAGLRREKSTHTHSIAAGSPGARRPSDGSRAEARAWSLCVSLHTQMWAHTHAHTHKHFLMFLFLLTHLRASYRHVAFFTPEYFSMHFLTARPFLYTHIYIIGVPLELPGNYTDTILVSNLQI